MPWEIKNTGGSRPYCVFKKGTSEKVGCHTTRAKAQGQIRALHANDATLEHLNDLIFEALAAAEEAERELAAVYQRALDKRGRHAVLSLRELSIQAAAVVPSPAEMYQSFSEAEREELQTAQDKVANELAAVLLIPLGLGFLAAAILETLAFRAVETFDMQVLTQIRTIVERGMAEGLSIADIAGALQSAFEGANATTAEMLARTHVTALTNESSLAAARGIASEKPIYKRWTTMLDPRVRPAHSAAEGQSRPLDSPFQIGGYSLMYPGDPSGPLALTANCRCILTYTRSLPLTASASILPPVDELEQTLVDAQRALDQALRRLRMNPSTLAWHQLWEERRAFPIVADAGAPPGPKWRGPLTVQNSVTPDRRMIAENALDHRELPLPLMALFETGPGGHQGAKLAGRIDAIVQEGNDFLGEGFIDAGGDAGAELIRLREAGMPLGISVDLAIHDKEVRLDVDADALEDENAVGAWMAGEGILVITKATILGATVAPMQAIDEANEIEILATDEEGMPTVVRAHGGYVNSDKPWVVEIHPGAIVASAGRKPASIEAFRRPESDHAHPAQYTDDGFIFGHLAPWDCCHVGWTVCTPPPASTCDYAYFHTGAYKTAEGEMIAVGKLVFSMDGDKHAPEGLDAMAAAEYYDDYTKCAGYVVARDGEHGIWLSGIQKPGLTEEELEFLRLHPMSGDWRPIRGFGESQLIAGFAVTVGGYPMPQSDMYLTASAGEPDRVRALIITPGWVENAPDETESARLMRVLQARAHGGVEALAELAHS